MSSFERSTWLHVYSQQLCNHGELLSMLIMSQNYTITEVVHTHIWACLSSLSNLLRLEWLVRTIPHKKGQKQSKILATYPNKTCINSFSRPKTDLRLRVSSLSPRIMSMSDDFPHNLRSVPMQEAVCYKCNKVGCKSASRQRATVATTISHVSIMTVVRRHRGQLPLS